MKAAVQHAYGSPETVVAVEDVPIPSIGPEEVLLRVRAAGVNWADQSMTLGKPYVMRLGYGLRRPRKGVRGTDVAGTVERVGSSVVGLDPGGEVLGWTTQTFAEYAAAKSEQLVPKPSSMSFEQAAGLPMAGCVALQALRDVAKIEPGQKVLVVGASGGIGSFMVQLAKHFGAEVTGVCSSDNVEFVRSLGADRVIDYTAQDFTESDERFDLIFDIADKASMAARRRLLTQRGTLIPNSGEGGPWLGSLGRIVKARLLSPFVHHRLLPFLSITKKSDLLELTRLVEQGELTPIVGKTYALSDAGLAIGLAGSGHARGKVIVTM